MQVGTAADDTLLGLAGGSSFQGGEGNDTIIGSGGGNTYYYNVGDGTDLIVDSSKADGAPDANALVFGAGIAPADVSLGLGSLLIRIAGQDAIHIEGFDPANPFAPPPIDTFQFADGTTLSYGELLQRGFDLAGTAADDTFTGTTLSDRMAGGTGNDTYFVDNAGDVVTENTDAGTDLVKSSITYVLGNNVENLTLTGTAALNGTGNALANVLRGNAGTNTLEGLGGADTIYAGDGDMARGGLGNDTLVAENTALSWAYLYGEDGDDALTGGAGYGSYWGGAGNDTIFGGADQNYIFGDDFMGAFGNDTIYGGAAYDFVIAGDGNDLVYGNGGNDLISGGAGADQLDGGAGDDTLIGGAGADALTGGTGDDTYYVDAAGDVVTESVNEGTDTVQSTLNYYWLTNNVENLTLGSGGWLAGGNDAANVLTGNEQNNLLMGLGGNDTLIGGGGMDWLDGGTGADALTGGTGNDSYYVDAAGDVVTENASEGTDTVQSALNYYWLTNNVENLTLGSSGWLAGGNDAANVLTGNEQNNLLMGLGGNDTLIGGGGMDWLDGGAGNDTYVLGRGHGSDTVQENDATAGNSDIASFLSGVAYDQIWLRHLSGTNNLEVSIIGTTDKLTIQNWYSGSQYHVEQIRTVDGNKFLLDSKVENLVQAMSAFAPPASGQTTLPQNYQDALAPVLAANWQ